MNTTQNISPTTTTPVVYTYRPDMEWRMMRLISVPHRGEPLKLLDEVEDGYIWTWKWPPSISFRRHLLLVFSFLEVYHAASELKLIPDLGMEAIVPREWLHQMNKALTTRSSETITIDLRDQVFTYASFHMMNRLLLSDYDQLLTDHFFTNLSSDHILNRSGVFRDTSIQTNQMMLQAYRAVEPYFDLTRVDDTLEKWEV